MGGKVLSLIHNNPALFDHVLTVPEDQQDILNQPRCWHHVLSQQRTGNAFDGINLPGSVLRNLISHHRQKSCREPTAAAPHTEAPGKTSSRAKTPPPSQRIEISLLSSPGMSIEWSPSPQVSRISETCTAAAGSPPSRTPTMAARHPETHSFQYPQSSQPPSPIGVGIPLAFSDRTTVSRDSPVENPPSAVTGTTQRCSPAAPASVQRPAKAAIQDLDTTTPIAITLASLEPLSSPVEEVNQLVMEKQRKSYDKSLSQSQSQPQSQRQSQISILSHADSHNSSVLPELEDAAPLDSPTSPTPARRPLLSQTLNSDWQFGAPPCAQPPSLSPKDQDAEEESRLNSRPPTRRPGRMNMPFFSQSQRSQSLLPEPSSIPVKRPQLAPNLRRQQDTHSVNIGHNPSNVLRDISDSVNVSEVIADTPIATQTSDSQDALPISSSSPPAERNNGALVDIIPDTHSKSDNLLQKAPPHSSSQISPSHNKENTAPSPTADPSSNFVPQLTSVLSTKRKSPLLEQDFQDLPPSHHTTPIHYSHLPNSQISQTAQNSQTSQITLPSRSRPPSSAMTKSVLNLPPGISPYDWFRSIYPSFTASPGSFYNGIRYLDNLRPRRRIPEFLHDDMLRVFATDFSVYANDKKNKNPLPAILWYNGYVRKPLYTAGAITNENFDTIHLLTTGIRATPVPSPGTDPESLPAPKRRRIHEPADSILETAITPRFSPPTASMCSDRALMPPPPSAPTRVVSSPVRVSAPVPAPTAPASPPRRSPRLEEEQWEENNTVYDVEITFNGELTHEPSPEVEERVEQSLSPQHLMVTRSRCSSPHGVRKISFGDFGKEKGKGKGKDVLRNISGNGQAGDAEVKKKVVKKKVVKKKVVKKKSKGKMSRGIDWSNVDEQSFLA